MTLKSLPELDLNIRYTRAPDGVELAYWSAGQGEPIVYLPSISSHIGIDWRAQRGKVYAHLLGHHQLIRYDGRGHGLSDRNPAELTLDALVEDLKTVVDALGLSRFTILSPTLSVTTAVAFAYKYPERVSRLIFWLPLPSYTAFFESSIKDALPLAPINWDLFTMTMAHIRLGWAYSADALENASLLRESVSQEFFLRELAAAPELDATPYLAAIRTPTLVLCRREQSDYEIEIAQQVARAIPTASLEMIEGYSRDVRGDAMREIDRFMGVPVAWESQQTSLPSYLHNRSHDLSAREIDVLRYLANGWRNKEIAADLGLSVYTVARHVATIYAKIGAHGRAEATRYAMEQGILAPRESLALTNMGGLAHR